MQYRSCWIQGLLFLGVLVNPAPAQQLTTLTAPFSKLTVQSGNPDYRGITGQTFLALGPMLTSFGFYGERFVTLPNVSPETMFQAELWAWGAGSITGSPLYTSDPFEHWATPGWFDFNVGGLSTTPGGSYFALLRELDGNTVGSAWVLGGVITNLFADGRQYFSQTNSISNYDFPVDEPLAWFQGLGFENRDLAFRATFASGATEVVPEPPTMTLLATGLAGMTATLRRRRKVS